MPLDHGSDCVPNIGPRQRRRRLVAAGALGAAAVATGAALLASRAPRLARLGVFLPLLGSAVGFFQWQDRT